VLAGVWLSIKTWKIKYSVFNESRSVAFSMYNLFFFLALGIISELVINGSNQRTAQFVVRSVVILLGTCLPICVLFIPKFTNTVHIVPAHEETKQTSRASDVTSRFRTVSHAKEVTNSLSTTSTLSGTNPLPAEGEVVEMKAYDRLKSK